MAGNDPGIDQICYFSECFMKFGVISLEGDENATTTIIKERIEHDLGDGCSETESEA